MNTDQNKEVLKSFRMESATANILKNYANQQNISRSEAIRQAINLLNTVPNNASQA